MSHRWLFADQLGPHFLDSTDQRVLLIESRAVFRRRDFHRQKAHLVLSALRHRAAELGARARFVQSDTYGPAVRETSEDLSVCAPTSYAARSLVELLPVEVLPARGFATGEEEFAAWVAGRGSKRLLLEDFYREARRQHDLLMDGDEPAGGRWNFDADNRHPPPRGATNLDVTEPWWPDEDDIDAEVRRDLDAWEAIGDVRFIGRDGPRWAAATREEALRVLEGFVQNRLAVFGPYEDAMLSHDPWMAHSVLSAPLNLGLLDPLEVVHRAERAYREGAAPLASVEGFVRQIVGWRDYVWNIYWHVGAGYRSRNALAASLPLPAWFTELDADAVQARCLSDVLAGVRDRGWVHHIPRLMVLGNYALQRGWDPAALTDWFHRSFVDGYDWVMLPNVVGMSQHADGGLMATKPYAAGGAYINRMSDYCHDCRYSPKKRTGEEACPYMAGYWWFLHRNRERLAGNHRMAQPLNGLDRLSDLQAVIAQERDRGSSAP